MFLRIGAMELKADEKKYMISVGYLIPDDEKLENPQVKPEFIYVIQSVEGEELKNTESHTYKIVGIIDRPATNIENYDAPGYTFVTYGEDILDSKYDVYKDWCSFKFYCKGFLGI